MEAFQERFIWVSDTAATDNPDGTDGAWVSGTGLLTVTFTVAEVVVFPATSRANAVSICVPLVAVVVSHVMLYGVARSSASRFTPSSLNCTPTTPTSSDAEAFTEMVLSTVASCEGAVRETEGACVSGSVVVFTVPDCPDSFPTAS